MTNGERVEEAVGQFLRLGRMMESGDLTEDQARRGYRALKATLEPEEWALVYREALTRKLRSHGWRVEG